MFSLILIGINNVFHLNNLIFIILGTVLGILIGAAPGLTATMGVALLIPITFKMDPSAGLCMLGAIYCGAIYGGSISAILIHTPGTSASVATMWDGYELTKKGLPGKALGISTISSFFGGEFSALCLLLIAPPLAMFSLRFGPPERFLLAVFGLTIIITLSSKSLLKGLISGFFGLLITTTGMQLVTGDIRFTFNQTSLISGIPLIPALIGLFSISEALILIETKKAKIQRVKTNIKDRILPALKDFKRIQTTILSSSIIGTIVGIIPGAGTSIGSYVSYDQAKRVSKNPEQFGKGTIVGIAASEAGNNAVTGGSLIPLLTLSIPGNAVSAVFLGGLLIHGLVPGPELFTNYGPITYTLMVSLFLSNLCLLIFGLAGAKIFCKVVKAPADILAPLIIILGTIGSYSLTNDIFHVYLMFVFGLIGYIMRKYDFPAVPIVLAIVLGPIAESELLRTLLLFKGKMYTILMRPICIILIGLIILSFVTSFMQIRKDKKKTI